MNAGDRVLVQVATLDATVWTRGTIIAVHPHNFGARRYDVLTDDNRMLHNAADVSVRELKEVA